MFREWEELPEYMKTDFVHPYYEKLKKKKKSLRVKRLFDLTAAAGMLVILFPVCLIISAFIAADSKGGVFFCQERVTQYGRKFWIIKFRTMTVDSEKPGSQVTVNNDSRVTRIGKVLRKYRLDEIPQLINIILGDMSFVGPRPEVPCFVREYTPEMFATLLLPAGVTSEASICYKDEASLLQGKEDVEGVYLEKILPEKMKYNLSIIEKFSLIYDLKILYRTVFVLFGRNRCYMHFDI